MIDAGATDLAVLGFQKGDSTGDEMDEGIMECIEANNCTFITEVRDYSTAADMTNAITGVLTTHPECNGILLLGGVPHEGCLQATATAIDKMGMTDKVHISLHDYVDGMEEYLDSGLLVYVFGGNQVFESQLAFVNLANCVVGTPLTDETHLTLTHSYLPVLNSEQRAAYSKYVEGDIPPYTTDEIRNTMIRANNPDFDGEQLKSMLANMSIDELVSRHADLF